MRILKVSLCTLAYLMGLGLMGKAEAHHSPDHNDSKTHTLQWSSNNQAANSNKPQWSVTNQVANSVKPQWSGNNIITPVSSNTNTESVASATSKSVVNNQVNNTSTLVASTDLNKVYNTPTQTPQAENLDSSVAWSVIQTSEANQGAFGVQIAQDSSGVVGDTFAPSAEELRQIRENLLIEPLAKPKALPPSPGSTLGVPSAYGASSGQAFVGGSGAVSNDGTLDGSISLGTGFGDPRKLVGVEVGLGITSIADSFGDRGTMGFKVHHVFPNGMGAAIAWSNPVKWGISGGGLKESLYGVVSQTFSLRPGNENNKLPLSVSLGLGTGAFRSKGAIAVDDNVPNVFASLGLKVIPRASVISSWTGNALNMGTSIAPFSFPVTVNLAATDVTDNVGFLFSTGYAFKF